MALKMALLAITLAVTLHIAAAWKRTGLGRPIWAHAQPPHLTVLSATGTLARLDASNGEIQWRLPAPLSTAPVTPRATLFHEQLMFIALSTDRVRAVTHDGLVQWELPGCGIAHPSQGRVVPVLQCRSSGYRFIDFEGNSTDAPEDHPRAVSELELRPTTLTWSVDDVVIKSQSDGLLHATRAKEVLWEREEGLSHPLQAGIYVRSASSVLVVLSELGSLFGLDGEDGTIRWKLDTDGDCHLYTGHKGVAVISCTTNDGSVAALAVDIASGEVLRQDRVDGFIAVKAALENLDMSIPLLRIVDEHGAQRTLLGGKNSESDDVDNRPWLVYANGGSSVSAERNGTTAWHVSLPSPARIVAVAKSEQLHAVSSRLRPPAVRVTGDRRLLFKYVDPNLALVLAHDAEATETHALLLDTRTGTVHDIVTHPGTAPPAVAVKGESWFAYSLWSTVMMQQELHIVDMYHQPRNISWVRNTILSAVSESLGPGIMQIFHLLSGQTSEQCPIDETAIGTSQCSADVVPEFSEANGVPYVIRSSSLLTQRPRSLDLTQTRLGLTEPSVIITLESGQVTLVSKFLLDARRPKETNRAHEDEYLLPYRPIISLESHSRDSLYFDEGNHIPGIKTIAVAPHHKQESICQVAVIGTDLVYRLEYPAGNYDSLPNDFFYSGVVGMLLALTIAYIYTRGLNVKASLAKSW